MDAHEINKAPSCRLCINPRVFYPNSHHTPPQIPRFSYETSRNASLHTYI